mmetsp:Transcript_72333/g.205707  ORF Transcript_72333/g.205707 Transcript_72333/m.205707 type:complete len:155 (-) Transcript_72333:55-519(-)
MSIVPKSASIAAMYVSSIEKGALESVKGRSRETVVVSQSNDDHQAFDHDHILRAMTDIVVLSTSDVLLTSSLSTFGYVAAVLLPRDKVWVQNYGSHGSTGTFPIADSVEPCEHFYEEICHLTVRDDRVPSICPPHATARRGQGQGHSFVNRRVC